jgi:hypothetical protein
MAIPPQVIVWLFPGIIVIALVVGGAVAWRSSLKTAVRTGGLALTLAAIAVQCGLVLYVLRVIIVAKTGYAQ